MDKVTQLANIFFKDGSAIHIKYDTETDTLVLLPSDGAQLWHSARQEGNEVTQILVRTGAFPYGMMGRKYG